MACPALKWKKLAAESVRMIDERFSKTDDTTRDNFDSQLAIKLPLMIGTGQDPETLDEIVSIAELLPNSISENPDEINFNIQHIKAISNYFNVTKYFNRYS